MMFDMTGIYGILGIGFRPNDGHWIFGSYFRNTVTVRTLYFARQLQIVGLVLVIYILTSVCEKN